MAILRSVLPEDKEFTFYVYASTRVDEMALVNWTAQKKEAFLRMQFQAQSQFYAENYPGAEFYIILVESQQVGRLYIHRREDEIRIMDISLLPEYRNQGIGSALLNDILEEGRQHNLPITIHVERFNPAMRLYERLGFRQKEDRGVYHLMEWLPMVMEQGGYVG